MTFDRLVIAGDDGILSRQATEIAELLGYRDIVQLRIFSGIGENPDPLFIALGETEQREGLIRSAPEELLVNLIHPSASVSPSAMLAGNVLVGAQAIVGSKARLGFGVTQNALSSIEHDDEIGDFTFLGTGAILCGRVTTGEYVFVGGGATVKPGVCIGARTTIGTGAVVVKNLPADGIFVGNPARSIGPRS